MPLGLARPPMWQWYRRRWVDLVASIYIYNEHRGYTALDRVLHAVQKRYADDKAFVAEIEQHRADEYKHYLMFRRWWERRGVMPYAIDRTCGHIDRFVEIMFRKRIDTLDTQAVIDDDRLFERLCRVISLTEQRGYRQLDLLLRHPLIRPDRRLVKIFRIIQEDEPSHWAPYEGWLARHGKRTPKWWERAIDGFIHSELLFLKLPVLFLRPGLPRRSDWPDDEPSATLTATAAAPGSANPGALAWASGFKRFAHSLCVVCLFVAMAGLLEA